MKSHQFFFRLSFCLLAYLIALPCHGQKVTDKINPLKIGDSVPDIVFSKMINYMDSTAKLSDFNGKSVLLDFWATWCRPCISAFPKLEELQMEFQNDLKIILVSSDKESSLLNFYSQRNGLILPTAYYNSQLDSLSELFPHREIPHYVWIDKKRKVYAITDASFVNVNNVKDFISGKANSMIVKTDSLLLTDFHGIVIDSIVTSATGENTVSINPNVLYQSTITKCDPRLTHTTIFGGQNLENRFIDAINCSVAHLVQLSHGIYSSKDLWKVYYDLRDTTLKYPSSGEGTFSEWQKQYSYSYRLVLPKSDSVLLYKTMQRDLEFTFGVSGVFKKMNVPCLVLRTNGNTDHILSRSTEKRSQSSSLYYLSLQNQPVSNLINIFYKYNIGIDTKLNGQRKLPIIDETGIKGNITFNLSNINNIQELNTLNQALKKVGLELIHCERELELLVISDKQ